MVSLIGPLPESCGTVSHVKISADGCLRGADSESVMTVVSLSLCLRLASLSYGR